MGGSRGVCGNCTCCCGCRGGARCWSSAWRGAGRLRTWRPCSWCTSPWHSRPSATCASPPWRWTGPWSPAALCRRRCPPSDARAHASSPLVCALCLCPLSAWICWWTGPLAHLRNQTTRSALALFVMLYSTDGREASEPATTKSSRKCASYGTLMLDAECAAPPRSCSRCWQESPDGERQSRCAGGRMRRPCRTAGTTRYWRRRPPRQPRRRPASWRTCGPPWRGCWRTPRAGRPALQRLLRRTPTSSGGTADGSPLLQRPRGFVRLWCSLRLCETVDSNQT